MSSILTNTGAMVALQSLKSINSDLGKTQNAISTGKMVASSKDNAAVWAISKVMESDVKGFKAISSSLSLGELTVSVARQASETVTDLLTQMKEKIVGAQESNVDRDKLQTDVKALRDQISSVVGAAQFNGLNLLSNQKSTTAYTAAGNVDGSGEINVLSSLDRSATGVASSDITVAKQDLNTNVGTKGALAVAAAAVTGNGAVAANGSTTITIVGEKTTSGRTQNIMAGDSFGFDMKIFDAAVTGATPFTTAGGTKAEALYVAKDGDTAADVAKGLADTINFRLAEQGLTDKFSASVSGGTFTIKNNTATATGATTVDLKGGGKAGGGLALLSELDVTTEDGASAALSAIEGLINTSIDSAAAFGSAQSRIETQSKFVSGLTDALKTGIGTLVDANMEETSARLQALQVQQQLGVQSLSIANQAPQSILSLFR